MAAVHVCHKVDLFIKLSEGSGQSQTTQQLASATGLDATLACECCVNWVHPSSLRLSARLLRHLSTVDFLKETGTDEWAPNDLTKAMAEPRVNGGWDML